MRSTISSFVQPKGTWSSTDDHIAAFTSHNGNGVFGGSEPITLFGEVLASEFSESSQWKAAVENDTCVADGTASNFLGLSPPLYNYAASRAIIIVACEALVGSFPRNASCMSNQLAYIKQKYADRFAINSTSCKNKIKPVFQPKLSVHPFQP